MKRRGFLKVFSTIFALPVLGCAKTPSAPPKIPGPEHIHDAPFDLETLIARDTARVLAGNCDADGGYLVPVECADAIARALVSMTPARRTVNVKRLPWHRISRS